MQWLDLFSGVGMYALGLEQAGHEVIGFCEKEEFCKKVLKKHWPMKPISSCIKSLNRSLMKVESLRVSRAKIYLMQGGVRALPAAVRDSSGILFEPFAWYDQRKSCWRTWQRCLIEGWEMYSGPWPVSGMTRNGIAFQRVTQERHISENEYTFLPTITANEGKGAGSSRYIGSPSFRGAKMSEGLRTCQSDPIYTNPNFAEAAMGLPKDWTLLETETRPVLSEK
jgi:hypothetical protein